jgi:glutamate/aspartate transport system substrate-binding protein
MPMGNVTRSVRAALRVLLMGCACAGADAAALEVRVASQEVLEPKWLHDGERIVGICPAIMPVILGDEPMYFRVGHRADPALAPLLGAALDRRKASGELDRICARRAELAP